MSNSGEHKTSAQESQPAEQEFKSQEGDVLPLTCSICRETFLDPVVTKCQHYFCETCARKHHEKNTNCFVCNQPTLGDFNTAVEIKKRIADQREEAKAMLKEASTMVKNASEMMDDAGKLAAKAVKMVEEVEKAAAMRTEAGVMAAKSAEMVRESEATMKIAEAKTAKAFAEMKMAEGNMAKAFAVMKTVTWDD